MKFHNTINKEKILKASREEITPYIKDQKSQRHWLDQQHWMLYDSGAMFSNFWGNILSKPNH